MMKFLIFFLLASSMNMVKEEGKKLGQISQSQALLQMQSIQPDNFIPFDPKGRETFDPTQAKEALKKGIMHSEIIDYLQDRRVQENKMPIAEDDLKYSERMEQDRKELDNVDLFGMDEEPSYEPNHSFSEITSKLALFDAIKQELEKTQKNDARAVLLFTGKHMECSKSVADDLLYDCCFTQSGLAKKMGLTTCSADEITLAEMREQGLCHYVGSYSKNFLDLWKSRDQHVFCCYSSKLARVLQENAHQQLNLNWQPPKKSPCRGLSMDQIAHLDFTKMDFSELYRENKLPDHFQSRLQVFEEQLKQKVNGHEAIR